MLRASSQTHAEDVNLAAVMTGDDAGGIAHGAQLAAMAEAVVGDDAAVATKARDELVASAGADAMIDAVGVASNFMRMVRIADSTGIVLGAFETETADIRQELGINEFARQE